MKKMYHLGFIMFWVMLSLCACESAQSSKKVEGTDSVVKIESGENANDLKNTENDIEDKEIACEIITNGDYNKLAFSFEELVQEADLIVKIRVEDVTAFIGNNGMIQTEITPVVQELYKGSYHDEKLYVNGGEMLYDEFCENELVKKALLGHENPDGDADLHGKYVKQSVDEQYIFHVGEEYIFFAKKREDSQQYYSLYAYQGTYKIIEDMVENVALDDEEQLKCDLKKIFSSQSETAMLSANERSDSGFITTEKVFAQKIKELK